MAKLTTQEASFYRNQGYFICDRPVFSQSKFERLRDRFESHLASVPDGESAEQGMDVPHFVDTTLFEWLLADEVLDLIEPILGTDITLFSSHFICKPAGTGKRSPWHTDGYYWRGKLSPMEVVTVWLAIDPAVPENGCMYVIPASHLSGDHTYHEVDCADNVFALEMDESQVDPAKAVPCVLQPNQASLHDAHTVHGAPANTSSMRRCGYTMRYIRSTTQLDVKQHDLQNLYLARGQDHGVNPLADPKRSYPEVRERLLASYVEG